MEKQSIIEQITFTLKIFCIIFGTILLSGIICFLTDIDGVTSVRAVIISALLACFVAIYLTLKRMDLI